MLNPPEIVSFHINPKSTVLALQLHLQHPFTFSIFYFLESGYNIHSYSRQGSYKLAWLKGSKLSPAHSVSIVFQVQTKLLFDVTFFQSSSSIKIILQCPIRLPLLVISVEQTSKAKSLNFSEDLWDLLSFVDPASPFLSPWHHQEWCLLFHKTIIFSPFEYGP